MRKLPGSVAIIASAAVVSVVLSGVSAAAPAADAESHRPDLGRQTLPAGDGWGSATTGTTGGSAAADADVHVATNRAELVAALAAGGAVPKIVYVRGTIDANTDAAGQPISCEDYAADGYSLEAYLAAFDPAVWGRDREPEGPLEDARVASALNQRNQIRIRVGANTTIVGLGRDATIKGANLFVSNVDNVIIRNITFEDAHDCFPQWDPTDGATGNWNSQYDNVSLTGATHVWVDHCTFTDGDNPDENQPVFFDRPFQVHDGQLDITNGSDLVTTSWNRFSGHGKTMLIGSTNTPGVDVGKLNVTVRHTVFDTVQERAPRVRFGKVHVFNNHYVVRGDRGYAYSLGVGVQSQTVARNNFFVLAGGVTPDRLIFNWGGTAIDVAGSLVASGGEVRAVDILAAHNAVNDPDIGSDVGWTPTLFRRIDPTWTVPVVVGVLAGAGRL